MVYPFKLDISENEHTFKIEKIDSDINLRLLTGYQSSFFENIYLTNCLKPTYILIKNPSGNEYSSTDNLLYFKSIIHSGEFYGSYKSTDYSPNNYGTLSDSFIRFDLTKLITLPKEFFFNVIELKCKTPGMLTFVFNGEHRVESLYSFSYNSFNNEGVTQNIFNSDHDLSLNSHNYTGNSYLEIFNIQGCANFDMNSLGGKTYECTDFYLNTTFDYNNYRKKFSMNVISEPFWVASIYHGPNDDDGFILEQEKKEYLCETGGMRIVIPINSEKKSIKIKSSIPKFFWSLDFTQKNISYLPVPSGSSLNYVYGDYAYIRNPYSFTQNRTTNYYWYIIIYHYNKSATPIFSYEYTDEENENKNPSENTNTKSFFRKPLFWVIIISIILIVCIVGIIIYFNVIKKKEDNLIEGKELDKLNNLEIS